MNENALKKLSYGLYVISAHEGNRDNGCIANTAMQLTSTPNRIMISLNKEHYTHGMIERTGIFNVSILSEKASFDTVKHWGFQSGAKVDKAAEITFSRAENGVIYLTEGVSAVISGKVCQSIDLGTHTLFIADVTDAFTVEDDPSATYAFYHSHIKQQAPAAPKKKGWICTVCGYVYEGEVLPPDYECPVCHEPASVFEKL